VVQSFLRGAERPVAFVLLASGGTLVGPSAGLALLWSGQRTALAYVAALAGGYLLAAVAGLILTARSGRLDMSWRGLGGALRLGTPTVPHQVALYIALGGLVVVADRTLALGGTANVALTLGAGATVLTGAMNNAWAPLIYRTSPERRALVLTRTTRLIVVAVACLTGAVSLLSPYLLAVAAPPTYDHAAMVPTVAVASLAAVASVFYLASGHLILVHGRTGVLSITTPTSVAAGIALAVPLSGYLGLPAVGLAYAAIYAALALLTTLAQRRLVSERWMPPFTPVTLSTAVAAAALGALAPADGAWVAVRVVATGLLVMGTLLALRRQLGTRQS
jgi:O-antigen/teichoic acid export membrane protein